MTGILTSNSPRDQLLSFIGGKPSLAIASVDRMVTKRDGTKIPFNLNRIVRAIALAFYEVRHNTSDNPFRNDPLVQYGLNNEDFGAVEEIAHRVELMLETFFSRGHIPSIENVQDTVQFAIAGAGFMEVSHAYMLYRALHSQRRLKPYPQNGGMASYIEFTKYARYRKELGRRELFPEIITRVEGMHREFFQDRITACVPVKLDDDASALAGQHANLLERTLGGKSLDEILRWAFEFVTDKRVLPSMRSLQFGGKPTLAKHARMFNCSFSNVDRVTFFREYMYLLLCGCGVGFSVQKHHVAMLPALPVRGAENDLPVWHYHIEDSIEGWADALHALFMSYYEGKKIEFDYSAIRPRGAELKTSGGKAPGHLPLKKALSKAEAVLSEAAGRNLRPIEVYDINMYIAKAVLAGGIRRSATICLFSPDDEEMMNAKTGNWFDKNPQRSASNNSAVVNRKADNRALFMTLFQKQKEFGEPGFFFSDDPDAGVNPCAEIGLKPTITGDQLNAEDIEKLYKYGFKSAGESHFGEVPAELGGTLELAGIGRLSGFQMCNLTTINAGANETEEELAISTICAAVIGTMQAAYTHIDYLSAVTRVINEKDALLGISICGFMANPKLYLNPDALGRCARVARAANQVIAKLIGINPAARITCVKPEGTASLVLGTASGIHPYHAKNYFRRVQANRNEEAYKLFYSINPQMTEKSVYNPDTDDVITFPASAPKGAITRSDVDAVAFLKIVRLVQRAWVLNGQNDHARDLDLHHNVSNTCTFKVEEADAVAEYIWENRQDFTGISLLIASGDKAYAQAPNEEVQTEGDIIRWNSLEPKPVDYARAHEKEDLTNLREIVACAGGACELR